jgi:hypothetical protein
LCDARWKNLSYKEDEKKRQRMERQEGTAKSPAPESRYRWHAFVMIGLLLLVSAVPKISRAMIFLSERA